MSPPAHCDMPVLQPTHYRQILGNRIVANQLVLLQVRLTAALPNGGLTATKLWSVVVRLTAALPNGGLTASGVLTVRLTAALPNGGLTAIAESKLWSCDGSTYGRTPKWRSNSDCRIKIVEWIITNVPEPATNLARNGSGTGTKVIICPSQGCCNPIVAGADSGLPSRNSTCILPSAFSSKVLSRYFVKASPGFSVPRTFSRSTSPPFTLSWTQRSEV